MRPILDVATDLGLRQGEIDPWGPAAAKVRAEAAFSTEPATGKLVLVSAINPTPAGEGKTTVSIGLTQAARKLGARAVCALRQPSLGPVFGMKGGGAGGGQASLWPPERINLHFTGDLHAVSAAHNLLAALVDNALHFGAPVALDPRKILWRRVVDMNDRALRRIVIGLGGEVNGVPREESFDITAASEVMAVLCLASDYTDLKRRLGDILVGFTPVAGEPVRARDLGAAGAMAALLRDALLPNLAQTIEGAPALVHGGPFGNIAHGCSSVVATRLALRRAEIVFTEAGFGFDLGGEKFLDIKCRSAGLWPDSVVLVATLRALRFHGGVPAEDAAKDDPAALDRGLANLYGHLENAHRFGLSPLVALNLRTGDSPSEVARVIALLGEHGVVAGAVDVFARGGEGATEFTAQVLADARAPNRHAPHLLYELSASPEEKIRAIATSIYGAGSVSFAPAARKQIERAVKHGYGGLPICMAKTHLSFSDDPKRLGRPSGFELTVREVRIAAGAGYLVALTGEILTMPGLPKLPQAASIDLTPDGTITGVR